ncbi:hypothetical protein MVEN_01139500 [Mycena venus]|uniref:Uncharacterized protein n=1 Tax=Mycena venus TaxID=2733690 RepID=A0A8H6Y9T8_9AGAR|nr:hypothetical protein MVEN_01139500 [Mycena venus]
MSTTATFSNVAVSTAFNGDAATSCISLAWILNAGLRTSNSRVSGLVNLPCEDGVISMTMDIPVVASLSHDLVLGMDWFQFVRAAAPQIIVHLSSGSLDVRQPLPSRFGANSHTVPSMGSSSVAPIFRGKISANPSASPLASSSTLRTRAVDVLAACTVAAPLRTSRTREVQASRTRDVTPRTRGVPDLGIKLL